MWRYEQSTGNLFDNDNRKVAVGYAGRDAGKNNPDMQNVKGIGPLPVGFYTICEPRDSSVVGRYAMPLTPDTSNEMFGRASFYMHGDSIEHPGLASHGCIVMPPQVRRIVWESLDHRLRVVRLTS